MRPTPRTQPYRLGAPRMPGLVLNAMLGGRQAGALNPADYRRQRMQMAAGGQPQATTDVRGFGQPPVAAPPQHGDVTATRAGLEASAVIRAIQALRAGQPIGTATQARPAFHGGKRRGSKAGIRSGQPHPSVRPREPAHAADGRPAAPRRLRWTAGSAAEVDPAVATRAEPRRLAVRRRIYPARRWRGPKVTATTRTC
jgi:hypothetical protein